MVTRNIYPPIPLRDFDWCAYDADACGCPECHPIQGFGKTEFESILDFLEQFLEQRRTHGEEEVQAT